MDYTTFKRKGLVRAARSKQVTVTSSLAPKQPSKADYIKALQEFDAEYMAAHPFRFMDLSPELRTQVYRELLTFSNSWTCFPEILAVNKQIHEEATNILYGDNLVEVKVWFDSIQAHGQRCGIYHPLAYMSLGKIEWPEMLSRVQWLRVTLPGIDHMRKYTPSVLRLRKTMSAILYSLCGVLSDGHSLRSFELDLKPLSPFSADRQYEDIIYPLTMLGKLQNFTVHISDTETIQLSNSSIHHPPQRTANINILRSAQTLHGQLQAYVRAVSRVSSANFGHRVYHESEQLGEWLFYERSYRRDQDGSYHNGQWEDMTNGIVERVREALVQDKVVESLRRKGDELRQAIDAAEELESGAIGRSQDEQMKL